MSREQNRKQRRHGLSPTTSREAFDRHKQTGGTPEGADSTVKPSWRSAVRSAHGGTGRYTGTKHNKRRTQQLDNADFALYRQALDLKATNKHGEAIPIIDDLITRNEDDVRLYAVGAVCAMYIENYDKTIQYWRTLVDKNLADGRIGSDLLKFIERRAIEARPGLLEEARNLLDTLIYENGAIDERLASQYAGYWEQEGNEEEQLRVLRHAIESKKADQRIFMKASSVLQGRGDHAGALAIIETAVERHCGDAILYLRLSHLYERFSDFNAAIGALETCMKRKKADDKIYDEHRRLTEISGGPTGGTTPT